MTVLSFRVDSLLHQAIINAAKLEDMTPSEWIEYVIRSALFHVGMGGEL